MVTFECGCGETFDPEREGGHKHADTARCPSCGSPHEAAREYLDAVNADEPVATSANGPTVTNAEVIATTEGIRLTVDVALGGRGGDPA